MLTPTESAELERMKEQLQLLQSKYYKLAAKVKRLEELQRLS